MAASLSQPDNFECYLVGGVNEVRNAFSQDFNCLCGIKGKKNYVGRVKGLEDSFNFLEDPMCRGGHWCALIRPKLRGGSKVCRIPPYREKNYWSGGIHDVASVRFVKAYRVCPDFSNVDLLSLLVDTDVSVATKLCQAFSATRELGAYRFQASGIVAYLAASSDNPGPV
eukprot:1138784-Pelagomonas_calceolata.AAC.1